MIKYAETKGLILGTACLAVGAYWGDSIKLDQYLTICAELLIAWSILSVGK